VKLSRRLAHIARVAMSELHEAIIEAAEPQPPSRIEETARDLFDNRMGYLSWPGPWAHREFWADLGEAIYGPDDERVVELRTQPAPERPVVEAAPTIEVPLPAPGVQCDLPQVAEFSDSDELPMGPPASVPF
jgi:hypothetical protein